MQLLKSRPASRFGFFPARLGGGAEFGFGGGAHAPATPAPAHLETRSITRTQRRKQVVNFIQLFLEARPPGD